MLVVRLELWPGGYPFPRVTLGVAGIANVSDLAPVSSYLTVLADSGGFRSVYVRDHRRVDGPWPLVSRATSPRASRRIPDRLAATADLIAERLLVVPGAERWRGESDT